MWQRPHEPPRCLLGNSSVLKKPTKAGLTSLVVSDFVEHDIAHQQNSSFISSVDSMKTVTKSPLSAADCLPRLELQPENVTRNDSFLVSLDDVETPAKYESIETQTSSPSCDSQCSLHVELQPENATFRHILGNMETRKKTQSSCSQFSPFVKLPPENSYLAIIGNLVESKSQTYKF